MSIETGIHSLSTQGLNIFSSAKVSDLPPEIYPFSEQQKKKTLVLVGNGGKAFWKNIPDFNSENPVDDFSLSLIKKFGKDYLSDDQEILFPVDDILLPLQKLTRYFQFSHQSPLGMDIGHEFGLWFAVRGVFLTGAPVPVKQGTPYSSPCDECREKPCLKDSDINNARLLCPVKKEHQYTEDQRNYHQNIVAKLKNQH